MIRKLMMFLIFLVCMAPFVHAEGAPAETRHRHIVMLRPAAHLRDFAAHAENVAELSSINGYIAEMTDKEKENLRGDMRVERIYEDVERHALDVATPIQPMPPPWSGDERPWGIDAVNVSPVWNLGQGSSRVMVEIVDTGIDYRHPDLQNCYAGGYDWVNNDDDPLDDNGHGTHVAGTICANQNNFGVIGVAPNIKVQAHKVLGADGHGTGSSIVLALQWIIDNQKPGVNYVISFSLGSSTFYPPEARMIEAVVRNNMLVVAAAGNLDADNPEDTLATLSYPAQYPDVLRVGAMDDQNRIASFSKYFVDVVAPGTNVLSDFPLGKGHLSTVEVLSREVFLALPMVGSLSGTVSAPLMDSGFGNPSQYPAITDTYVALVSRGDGLTFAQKVDNGLQAHAAGFVIYNNVSGSFQGTLGASSSKAIAVCVSDADGARLRTYAGNTAVIRVTAADYEFLNGTSMATPHVSGLAALLWSLKPDATPNEVKYAIMGTAQNIGADFLAQGMGKVNAYAAAQYLLRSAPARRRGVRH